MSAGSPKRKRGQTLPLQTDRLGPRLLSESDLDDHAESPRTKVARQLDDLDIHDSLDKLNNPATGSANNKETALEILASRPVQSRVLASPKSKKSIANAPHESEQTKSTSPVHPPRSKTPPLAGELSDDFWHDSEITGHDPDDPDDDGYGINGIGFKPTAALAWSRSQQRKQQLNDYKARENREARRQRSERRKRVLDEEDEALAIESSPRKAVRVHFEDG